MATMCYSCFDEMLFRRLGPGAAYYKQRELYDCDPGTPFTCVYCGYKVDPMERQGAQLQHARTKTRRRRY